VKQKYRGTHFFDKIKILQKKVGDEKMKIPKDQISSGNRDSKCWAKFYGKTEEEVGEKIQRYFCQYPSEGYATRIAVGPKKHLSGYWYCRMKRWHSCD